MFFTLSMNWTPFCPLVLVDYARKAHLALEDLGQRELPDPTAHVARNHLFGFRRMERALSRFSLTFRPGGTMVMLTEPFKP